MKLLQKVRKSKVLVLFLAFAMLIGLLTPLAVQAGNQPLNGPANNQNPMFCPKPSGGASTNGNSDSSSDSEPEEEKMTATLSAPDEVYLNESNQLSYVLTLNNIQSANRFWFVANFDVSKLDYTGYDILIPEEYNMMLNVGQSMDDIDADGNLYLNLRTYTNKTITIKEPTAFVRFNFEIKDTTQLGDNIPAELLSVGVNSLQDGRFVSVGAELTNAPSILVTESTLKYDVDGNGLFNEYDIDLIIYKYYLFCDEDPEWPEIQKYDLLPDGIIDAGDILAFYSFLYASSPQTPEPDASQPEPQEPAA